MENYISKKDIEFFELEVKPNFDELNYQKISISNLLSYGLSIQPLVSTPGKSGFYYAKVPKGETMRKKKGSSSRITSTSVDDGSNKGQIKSHADLVSLPFDPMSLVIAISLNQINNKLDEIAESQEKIMTYLIEKDRASQRANLKTLIDIYNQVQDNWNNKTYRQNKHILVQEIRRDAEKSILFHKNSIKELIEEKKFILVNSDIINKVELLNKEFKEYNLANYLFAFSTYIEVILLGNLSSKTILNASESISNYAFEYRRFYTETYTFLEKNTNRAIESTLFNGFSEANKLFSKVSDKIPIKINRNINKENKFEQYLEDNLVNTSKEALASFTENRFITSNQFSDNLEEINDVYNTDQSLYIDENNVYIIK